ncbi:FAD-dependent oxidoreductase [Niabella sp.]|uniref:FAD-dependent oxidoreductase n=1 Tax=Niabella sp. TaxID=1962976 RepID=UPI00261913A2|nr:FAD-dependent oxidoreductase [Niabella sp.]
MKEDRRGFLKMLGLGSGALLMSPVATSGAESKQGLAGFALPKEVFATRKLDTDVLIAGGGMAGVCAAIAAARNGVKVVLLQNRSRLGGNASSEIRMHICGATQLKQVWRETGILEEIMLTESVTNPQKSYEVFDYVMYDKVMSEKNITLLFDTMLFEVQTKNDRITLARAFCSATEELYEISARYYTDCTGDGTMAALAGAAFMTGREARSQWGESLGLEKADSITMGNSILFMAEEQDKPVPYTPPNWARKYTAKDFIYRKIRSWEYGYWWLELGGTVDIIKDGQALRHELLSVLFGVWDYIKNSGNHPNADNWALSWIGAIQGKRESRRITGDYVLVQKDIQSPQLFEDRIAYGGWPLDDHLPAGMDDTSLNPFRSIPLKGPYSIPMRSLYSKSFSNLLMAGRNISVSHVALSTTRVMATCALLGQAVGTAAAYCIHKSITPKALCADPAQIAGLQQLLLRQDQAMLGVRNTDPDDLARLAKVRASSETMDGKAANVIDGVNRDIADGNAHQWRADMSAGEVWIELKWPKPLSIATVECTFDTGLNRFLRISGEKAVMKNQVRGVQPETVADYKITMLLDGKVVHETVFKNNFLRKVAHTFSAAKADTVRITITRTNGDPLARVFEVRCYA